MVIDLTGQTFGHLTVISQQGLSKFKAALWLCKCDCGNFTVCNSNALRTGHAKSCGCQRKKHTSEWLTAYNTTHGKSHTRLYQVWNGMIRRVSDPKNKRFKDYGGRGIKVCEEWRDFEMFYRWAVSHGYDADAPYGQCTIDRINVDGNYEPDNCRWVDLKTQAKNKRKDVKSCSNAT